MDRLCLTLVVLLGLTHQVLSQTIQVDTLAVTMLQGSGTYIEADASHEFIFDVAITLAPGQGADDPSVDKWDLQVELFTNPATPGTPALVAGSMKTLELGGANPLTAAQANLPIAAGATGTMRNVRVTYNLGNAGLTGPAADAYLCPDTCPDDDATSATDMRYRLKVTLQPGTRGGSPYTLASTTEALVPLTCRGVILNVVPVITTGLPLKENMVNALMVDVLVTSDANGRSITNAGNNWDLIFTLEKDMEPVVDGDRDVIETLTIGSFTGEDMTLAAGGSITFTGVSVSLDLAGTGIGGTDGAQNTDARVQTTCVDFEYFCVEVMADGALAAPNMFTFSGSESINTDTDSPGPVTKNPKRCVSVQCNGVLIDSVSIALADTSQMFCQATASNTIDLSVTVTLSPDSAPLTAGKVDTATPGNGEGIWQLYLFGSSTSDCTLLIPSGVMGYTATTVFGDMAPGQPNVFPEAQGIFDLSNFGCPQVEYICGQLFRSFDPLTPAAAADPHVTNLDFTYGFTNPAVSSVSLGIREIPNFPNMALNTHPMPTGASQWGSTAITCKGVTLDGTSLTLDSGNYIGEYTDSSRMTFTATFTESATAPECFVRGSDLWKLEAFVAVGNEGTPVTEATAKTLQFADVPLDNVELTPGQEDQDVTAADGILTFASATADFDFSKLDCQQGPFAFCVELKKGDSPSPDFTLVPNANPHVVCQIPAPCVGAELEETTIMQAQAPMIDDKFPVRQGVAMHEYFVDVKVTAKSGSGSIAIPEGGFPAVAAGVTRGDGNDLWDMDVFLATDNQGGGQITPIAALDDRCAKTLPDYELQAGQSTTFETVRVPLDTSKVQCSEFSHMCVTVKNGASHDQAGSAYVVGTDFIRMAPTIEGIVANMFFTETGGLCPANVPDTADVMQTCPGLGNDAFCAMPSPRPDSAATACMPVTCVGVRIQSITCNFNTARPAGATTEPVSGRITEGSSGYFHLSVALNPDPNAGGVIGTDLWKITVFLSPNIDGSVVTVSQPALPAIPNTAWEDANIVPGVETTFDIYTAFATADQFMFDFPCEEILFLCVKIEKADNPKADNDGAVMDFKVEDDSVMIKCNTLPSCGGVVLEDMTLALDDTSAKSVTEKQISTHNNELKVDVGLQFHADSAEFTPGTNFWDIDFFLAEDSAGNTKMVDAKNAADFDHITAAVDAGATTAIATKTPQFDLTDRTCRPADATHANPYVYLCATVKKNTATSPAATPDFTLTPAHRTKCILVTCEGVVFETAVVTSAVGGPVLEAEMNNAITVAMRFPIQNNGGQVAANYPSDLWRVTVFLSPFANGLGTPRLVEKDVELTAQEIRSPVQSQLVFSNKQVSLDMFGQTCPSGGLHICVQIRELAGATPDCTIDTTAAIGCQPMGCRAVKFTGAQLMFDSGLCLVEHKALNLVQFDFEMSSEAGYASVSAPPGRDLWQVSAYSSVSQAGEGINRFGLNQTIFETSLVSGQNLKISATLQLNLESFVCPKDQLYMCVELDRNTNAVPIFSFESTSLNPRRSCKTIECKGVKMTNIAILEEFSAVTERSGPTTVTSDIRVHADENYAGVTGTNLWTITGELRDPDRDTTVPGDGVILTSPAVLTPQQSSEGLVPGSFTTFNGISVNFDLNRNVPCPAAQRFDFCVKFAKGPSRYPDFSIDDTSVTESCRALPCKGVCVEASAVSFHEEDAYIQEGVSTQVVHLDAKYVSDPEYAGIVDQEAKNLWKVKVFASPDGTQRVGETDGVLATNNENYPLAAGGTLELTDITATLDFTGHNYVSCLDAKYICVELMRDPASVPTFSLFGCPSTRLVHCAVAKCRGVLLESVTLTTVPSPLEPRENTQSFPVNFGLRLTPHNGESKSSVLPNGGANSNYWQVELFGSATNPPENWSAKTIATIPSTELMKGIPDITTDQSLSGLTANMDLSNTFCGNFKYLCARVMRGPNANPEFTLNGFPDDNALVGCTTVNCEGVDIDSATVADLQPDCVVEGNGNYEFSYDASFITNLQGGGVFGSNLWKLRTFLATAADGTGEIDIDGENPENAVYPTLPFGSESQTLQPGQPLGFQNVEGSLDTRNFKCPDNGEVYFCVRLEKDEEKSTSAFTLSSPIPDRQMCTMRPCKGVTIARNPATDPNGALVIEINPDRTIITEREPEQKFELDIIARTAPDTGSISGEKLWELEVFFNDKADGTGNDYDSTKKVELEEENANRPVAAGGDLIFNDVDVELSAEKLLCGPNPNSMFMCVRISRNAASEPAFTLNPSPVVTCRAITCNPVIILTAECEVNAPEYLLENVNNNLNFEFKLTSANVSASIFGTNLWSLNRLYTNNMEDGMGPTTKVNQVYTTLQLNQQQRDRGLEGGNSLILQDVQAFLDLTSMTCADIKSLCVDFGKSVNPAPNPDFTLSFDGSAAPPWCKKMECRGVRANKTELIIDTASVKERTPSQKIIFDVTLYTDAGSASISGTNLWTLTPSFEDSEGNAITSDIPAGGVPLGTVDRSLTAGIPLNFSNIEIDPAGLENVVCPEGGLYLCVVISKNGGATPDFTLEEEEPGSGALKDCTPLPCTGVQFSKTETKITSGIEIDEAQASATHVINFDFEAVSRTSSTPVSGTKLWKITTFGSRKEDGSGVRHLERGLTLSQPQADQALAPGATLPFNGLSVTFDMRGVRCIDFQYFCTEISRDGMASLDFSVQGIDESTPGTARPEQKVLRDCMKMQCQGVYITIFGVSPDPPDAPPVLLENKDDQVFIIDAYIESDVTQQDVTGANLWAMKAFFNPSPNCDAIDNMGNHIRLLETDAVIFGGEDDQNLMKGGSINFNNVRVELDFQDGTCESLGDATYLCFEIIRSQHATPTFTLLGNNLRGMPAECKGVEVMDTRIVDASWTPQEIVERSAGQRRKRQTNVLTFDLDVQVNTNVGAAGVNGDNLWKLDVYLSGDEECTSVNAATMTTATLTAEQANQDLLAGGILLFDINGLQVPFNNVLCKNARFVCVKLAQGDAPTNEFTLEGVPDESALVGSYPLDCKGVEIINSQLTIHTGVPLIAGDPNHQLVFSFQINTAPDGAGISGTDLFTLFVFGNDQEDGFGKRAGEGYVLPISQDVTITPGVPNSFGFRPALLNLQGVSCEEVPYVCVQIFEAVDPKPPYTLQPSDPASPVFTDCAPVACSGVHIDNLVLDFQSGLPILEGSPTHQVHFIIKPTASIHGASAVGDDLWEADIFINSQENGSGPKIALTSVNIIDNDINLNKGTTIDLLANAVLDLTEFVCVRGQYICVDLRKGPEADPDFTLGGVMRACHHFTCKGVDLINPGMSLASNVVLRMLTSNTHVEFNAYVDAAPTSSSVTGSNLFKVSVFASANSDGVGERYGESYADVSYSANAGIHAGQRTHLNEVKAYLDLTGVKCDQLKYVCIQIWKGDYANPDYQIDSPSGSEELRVCQRATCYGVQIAKVVPSVSQGSPLIENAQHVPTLINIELQPSSNSASIVGDNLWKATCYANSREDGSGIRYSVKNAILQQSELDKDLLYSTLLYTSNPDPLVLENAQVSMDYSSRHCSEIQYVCCTIGENDNANPDFKLEGAYGNENLLTGCTLVPCLGVGVTSTRLELDDLEILKGDEAHTFSGDVLASVWRHSRAIQEDNTWAMSAYVLDNDHNPVTPLSPVELIQQQQDLGAIPGNDLEFQDLNFQMNLAGLECFQIAYVCVKLTTQAGVSFTLQGVHDSGELNPDALIGCSPHLQCSDFAVDIQVTDVGERHIEIEWNEGEGDFDTYVITYAPEEPRVESPQYIPRELRAPLRFDGLTPGQEYTFNLYLYKGGVVKAGPVVEVERANPATVDVTISRQTNSELHVQWTEAEGIYDTYIVDLYPQGTPPTPLYVDAAAPRELIFSGLREAREYTVTIYTAVGGRNGYRSEPGYASEITEPAAPFLELDLTNPGTRHVDLVWTPPSGYRVEGFKLTSDPHEQGTNLPAELGSDVNAFRVTGLMPGREYKFLLEAYALVGNGLKIYSDPSVAHARTHPAPVTHAEVEIATINSIVFTWDAVPGDVDSYRIHFNEQNGPDKTISAILPRRHTEGNLALATQYEFTITALSGGLESEEFHFYASTRPNRPGVVRPENVDVDLIQIMWEPAPGPSDGYEITYSPTHPEYHPESPYFTTDLMFTLSGLHPHTTVDFEVRNVVRGMKSDPQEWRQRTFPDLPGAVEDLHIEPSGPSSVVLRFSQPEYPNGLITAYIVSYEGRKPGVLGVDAGLFTITALPNEHDFEREIPNLRSGYTYSFNVRAANSEGQGESTEFQGITLYAGLPLLAEKWYDPDYNYFAGVEPGSYTIDNVPIDATAFSDINGEIVGYAIIIVEAEAANLTAPDSPPSYNQARKYDPWPAYQTEPIKTIDELAQQQSKRSILSFVYYDVGTDKDCPDQPVVEYKCNGPLVPLTTYKVSVRAYTEAGYVTTPWSHVITTRADRWWFAYAAIPFLFVVFVLAIILALLACSAGEKNAPRRRKYQNKYTRDDFTDYGADNYNENVNMNASGSTIFMLPTSAEPPLSGSIRSDKGKLNPTHVLGTRPVQISKFQHHVETMAANNAMKFVEEYENLRPIGDDLARLIGGLPENKDKNRFSNILPYDYNRVQLNGDTYINSSFIGGFNSRHEYIASQGPLSNTVDEFWRMVWENNCPTIVMMGRCVEDGHVKSEQYWPEADKTVTYGNLSITMVSEKIDNDWTIRDFTIQSGSEIRAVRQFNFTAWPNHGVPEKTDGVVRFVSTVRAEAPQHSGPMIIHCGAGIGRTGIFLALDILMQGLVYDETTVDVYGTVSSLRKQRCCMVQTVHQYIFLHKAMLDVLQGKASGYNWLLRTRKGSIVSRDSDQMTSDTL